MRCPDGHRTIFEKRQEPKKSANAHPGTGRCFMSRTATGEKRRVLAEVCIYIDILLLAGHRTEPGQASADVIIQTPTGARTICDHARVRCPDDYQIRR